MPKPRNWKPARYEAASSTVLDFTRLSTAMITARLKLGRDRDGRKIPSGRYGAQLDSNRAAASRAGIGSSTWHRVETGTLRPSANTFAKLCLFLDVPMDTFYLKRKP